LQVPQDLNKPPPQVIERRLRIFQTTTTATASSDIQDLKYDRRSFNLESLSSSKACLSGCFTLSDTIFEEVKTQSTLTAIRLFRITSDTFDNHPFLDSSYGKDVSKLSFEGPCSLRVISTALEYFPAIQFLEFTPGFFLHDDDDFPVEFPPVLKDKEFPNIKSLVVNCDVRKYIQLKETARRVIHQRIVSLLDFASTGISRTLNECNFKLPNTCGLDRSVNEFSENIGSNKGWKWVDFSNMEVISNYYRHY